LGELALHLGGETLPEVSVLRTKARGQPSRRDGSERGPAPSELPAFEEQYGGARSVGRDGVAELGVMVRPHDVGADPVPGTRIDLDELDLANAATAGCGERIVEDDGPRSEPEDLP
jgi:hypothetical protein